MGKNLIENELIKTAIETLKNSHSPHSGFKVGSAILTKKGIIYRVLILSLTHLHSQYVLSALPSLMLFLTAIKKLLP